MQLTEDFRKKILISFVAVFYITAAYKFSELHLLMFYDPVFFTVKQDFFSWLFMQTGWHRFFMNHGFLLAVADVLFYTAPAFLLGSYFFARKLFAVAAWYLLIINWFYVHLFILFPTNSIEGHLAWLLFPLVFIPLRFTNFYFLFKALRYYFLFFFFSAGLWKLRQYGFFHIEQMSGILLMQHKELLISNEATWQINFVKWLIANPPISYCLYFMATVLELSFIIGFFTNRFDKVLLLIFVAFLMADYLIMRIPYLDMSPFLITLMYDRKMPSAFEK